MAFISRHPTVAGGPICDCPTSASTQAVVADLASCSASQHASVVLPTSAEPTMITRPPLSLSSSKSGGHWVETLPVFSLPADMMIYQHRCLPDGQDCAHGGLKVRTSPAEVCIPIAQIWTRPCVMQNPPKWLGSSPATRYQSILLILVLQPFRSGLLPHLIRYQLQAGLHQAVDALGRVSASFATPACLHSSQ